MSMHLRKYSFLIIAVAVAFTACKANEEKSSPDASSPIIGSWKLISGTLIEKGDTVVTDYTTDRSFVKIINDTHFAFLTHTLRKDTTDFGAGGGTYAFDGKNYTEHLEYCNAKEWEGHDFNFTIEINGDTLIQSGAEKIEAAGVDRINIEKYVRYKK